MIIINIIIIITIIVIITIIATIMIMITLILTDLHDPRRSPGLQCLHKVCVPFLPVSDGGDESGGNDGGLLAVKDKKLSLSMFCFKIFIFLN